MGEKRDTPRNRKHHDNSHWYLQKCKGTATMKKGQESNLAYLKTNY